MTFPDALPAPRTPDPRDAPVLRWGVVGPGWIADRFVTALQRHTRQEVVAVASRDRSRAEDFASRFSVPHVVDDYAALMAHPDVEIVYVATTHDSHADLAVAAMEHGKHVLVEKPLATDSAGVRRIIEVAERTGRFCCEALWTMFLPKWDVVLQVLESGALGRVRSITGDYGEHFTEPHRIFEPALAGGPLLDIGVYPVSMITTLLGAPRDVVALGTSHPSGVNAQLGAVMQHDDEAVSVVMTTLHGASRNEIRIIGTEGTLVIEPLHNSPGPLTVASADGAIVLRHEEPSSEHDDGLHFQAAEAARRIAAGETGSPLRPLSASLTTAETMDRIAALVDGS